jgi:hypothetical protein
MKKIGCCIHLNSIKESKFNSDNKKSGFSIYLKCDFNNKYERILYQNHWTIKLSNQKVLD